MNRNKSLQIALVIGKVLSVLLLLTIVLLTVILIHWHIDRAFYAEIPIGVVNFYTYISFTVTKTSVLTSGSGDTPVLPMLNNIGRLSLYLIYSQFVANLLLALLSIREFIKVIESVKKVQTFISRNTHSFKKISYRLFLIFLLSSFQIISYDRTIFYGFYLHVEPLLLALLSYSMSEIFKEGNILLEENNATI